MDLDKLIARIRESGIWHDHAPPHAALRCAAFLTVTAMGVCMRLRAGRLDFLEHFAEMFSRDPQVEAARAAAMRYLDFPRDGVAILAASHLVSFALGRPQEEVEAEICTRCSMDRLDVLRFMAGLIPALIDAMATDLGPGAFEQARFSHVLRHLEKTLNGKLGGDPGNAVAAIRAFYI